MIGLATYLFLWPADGILRKEDVRKVYDGSIFYEAAEENKRKGNNKHAATYATKKKAGQKKLQ